MKFFDKFITVKTTISFSRKMSFCGCSAKYDQKEKKVLSFTECEACSQDECNCRYNDIGDELICFECAKCKAAKLPEMLQNFFRHLNWSV